MAFHELQAQVSRPGELFGRLRALEDAWIVGGWLRDAWLGRPTQDIDLAVSGDLPAVLMRLSQLFDATPFELGLRHGSHRLVAQGATIDISPVYGGSIEADLQRRDYTVNAMALATSKLGMEIEPADLISHAQALADLQSGTLSALSRHNLEVDPLRLLRGYRLCAELGFTPAAETRQAWRELAPRVTDSAAERLHEELLRLLCVTDSVSTYVEWLAQDGVLWQLVPELQATAGCEQNAYHHLDVWSHTLEALTSLDQLRRQYPAELTPFAATLDTALAARESGLASGLSLLRLALLLHDIDKPRAREVQADGRITFYQHQEMGGDTAREVLTRLKFSTHETDLVCLLVLEHLRLGFYSDQHPLPPKLVYRFIRRLGPATPLAVIHGLADCLATRGPLNEDGLARHLAAGAVILEHYCAGDRVALPPTLLDGKAIMELLGISPGKLVGELKELLAEATADGEVNDSQEAQEYVRRAYKRISAGD